MKGRILNLLLITTSLLGYLEWGGNNHIYLIKAEAELFRKLFVDPASVLHPFIVLPFISQLLLLFTLCQKTPSKTLTYIGIVGLGLLLGFMFIIGVVSANVKILLSTIPFLLVVTLEIIHFKKIKRLNAGNLEK